MRSVVRCGPVFLIAFPQEAEAMLAQNSFPEIVKSSAAFRITLWDAQPGTAKAANAKGAR